MLLISRNRTKSADLPQNSAGFTLIEVLIVVVIIAVFMILLIPVHVLARRSLADPVDKNYPHDERAEKEDPSGVYTVKVFYGTDRKLVEVNAKQQDAQSNWKFLSLLIIVPIVYIVAITRIPAIKHSGKLKRRLTAACIGIVMGCAITPLASFILTAVSNASYMGIVHPNGSYGSDRGDISYGVCRVSIPKDHQLGALETPSIYRFQVGANPEKHIMLKRP